MGSSKESVLLGLKIMREEIQNVWVHKQVYIDSLVVWYQLAFILYVYYNYDQPLF